MASPVPLAGSVYKFTYIFNDGINGWTDTWYFVQNSALGLNNAKTAATSYFLGRVAMVNSIAQLVGVRVTSLGTTTVPDPIGITTPIDPVILDPKNGGVLGGYQKANMGVLIRVMDVSLGLRRMMILRALPTEWTLWENDGGPPAVGWPNPLKFAVVGLQKSMSNGYFGLTPSNAWVGNFAIRFRIKDPLLNPTYPVLEATVGPNNWLSYVVSGVPAMPAMRRGVFHAIKGKCAKGLNGPTKVVSVIPNSPAIGQSTINTTKKWCCAGVPVIEPGGTYQALMYGYAATAEFSGNPNALNPGKFMLIRAATRDTGRAFFATRGKSASGCC